eukprot:TRINITY_DN3994_c0_g1_i1.p1 TRINITY_DN3994_c0_g1~~TRINITY_DN3994_c0_g1_i1.p1  ORF type:complete len:740 (+),score=132.92 TRINITY_DN3994_c0_g1_i1:22-2241(+)
MSSETLTSPSSSYKNSSIVKQRVIAYSTLNLSAEDRKWIGELELVLVHLTLTRSDIMQFIQMISQRVQENKSKETHKSNQILRNGITRRILKGWVCRFRFKKMLVAQKKQQTFVHEFVTSEDLYTEKLLSIQQIRDELVGPRYSQNTLKLKKSREDVISSLVTSTSSPFMDETAKSTELLSPPQSPAITTSFSSHGPSTVKNFFTLRKKKTTPSTPTTSSLNTTTSSSPSPPFSTSSATNLLGSKDKKERPRSLSFTGASKTLTYDEYSLLFGSTETLLGVHKELHLKAGLKSENASVSSVIEFLKGLAELQRYYLPYIQAYSKVNDVLVECMNRKKFREQMRKAEAKLNGMTLSSLYASILYRHQDYINTTEVLLSWGIESELLNSIYQKLLGFQKEADDLRENQELFEKTISVHNRILNFPVGQRIPISREFIHEGQALISIGNINKAPSMLFLFNDIMIISGFKTHEYQNSFPTTKMQYKQIRSTYGGHGNAIELRFQDDTILTLTATNQQNHESWLDAFDTVTKDFRIFGLPPGFVGAEGAKSDDFFDSCIRYFKQPNGTAIREEGVFRISAQKTEMEDIVCSLNRGNIIDLNKLNPIYVASLLKYWLNNLPYPLLLSPNQIESYNCWISLASEQSEEKQKELIGGLILKIPESNQRIARKLFKLLFRVTQVPENKMGCPNLAIIFSPLLLHPRDEKFQLSLMRNSSLLEHLRKQIETLIVFHNSLCPQKKEKRK